VQSVYTLRLPLKAYNVSIVKHLTDVHMVVRMEFCKQMFHAMSQAGGGGPDIARASR
jgi:hypothetical protein